MLFLLLFFALRQPARSTSAQQKPVALLFVHPAFVVLIKAFDFIQNKCEATHAKRKTRATLYCCCFPLCVKHCVSHHSVTKPGCTAVCASWFCYAQNQACSFYPKPKFRAACNIQQYFSVAFRGLGNAPFKISAKHKRKAEKHQ